VFFGASIAEEVLGVIVTGSRDSKTVDVLQTFFEAISNMPNIINETDFW
jgi:hypothetical protein